MQCCNGKECPQEDLLLESSAWYSLETAEDAASAWRNVHSVLFLGLIYSIDIVILVMMKMMNILFPLPFKHLILVQS